MPQEFGKPDVSGVQTQMLGYAVLMHQRLNFSVWRYKMLSSAAHKGLLNTTLRAFEQLSTQVASSREASATLTMIAVVTACVAMAFS
jgi:hypothetical protein